MSLPELRRAFAAVQKRLERDAEGRRAIAWMTAALGRAGKKFPAFDAFVIGKTRRQTPREMASMLTTLAGQFGGRVQKG